VAFGGTGIALPDGYSFQRRDLHTYHPDPAKTVVPAPPPSQYDRRLSFTRLQLRHRTVFVPEAVSSLRKNRYGLTIADFFRHARSYEPTGAHENAMP
jgi:hypothetical protein